MATGTGVPPRVRDVPRTVGVLVFGRRARREAARDRMVLLEIIREQNDRIMQLAGTPWNLPPREPVVEPDDSERGRWIATPEMLP